jgi:signal transduction histidine kinase
MSLPDYRRVIAGPNRVYWYCLLGLMGWAVMRHLGVDAQKPPIQVRAFLLVMVLEGMNLFARFTLQRQRVRTGEKPLYRLLGWLFVVADFLLIVAGVRLTGGLDSPIWVVTFVVVSGETVLEGLREAVLTRLSACIALFLGTVPLPPQRFDAGAYALEMFVRMGLLLAVSSVIRRLREGNDSARTEVATLRGELALAQERTRLSREVHDGVGNSLAAGVLRLEAAARMRVKTHGEDDETAAVLKEEASALREAMQGVRDWTFHTRPWNVGDDAASQTLLAEADRLTRRTGLSVAVKGAPLLDALPPAGQMAALRIVQERLTNAAKHAAGATQVLVTLVQEPRQLRLNIADDGPGFDTEAVGTGIGLASMRERATGLGGTLSVESASTGTTIRLTLPLSGSR